MTNLGGLERQGFSQRSFGLVLRLVLRLSGLGWMDSCKRRKLVVCITGGLFLGFSNIGVGILFCRCGTGFRQLKVPYAPCMFMSATVTLRKRNGTATAEQQRPSECALARKATSDPCLLSPYANQTVACSTFRRLLAFGVK